MLIFSERLNRHPPSVHIPTRTGSADCIELAKSWIADCQAEHKCHCSLDNFGDSTAFLPSRLLFVGDNLSSVLRLEETSAASLPGNFTLRYCQGENGNHMPQKLTTDKKDEWRRQINEKELPLTFQHVVQLTRQTRSQLPVDRYALHCPRFSRRLGAGIEERGKGVCKRILHSFIRRIRRCTSGLFPRTDFFSPRLPMSPALLKQESIDN